MDSLESAKCLQQRRAELIRFESEMNTLPVYNVIGDIRDALSRHNRLILQAPPGAGKTTAVPLALLDEAWLENKQIIILEPRRISARSAAGRMAQILGEEVGERIGYQIRSEKKISEKTKIVVVTEGILTRRFQNDPSLENIALIIFDEFHERHLHSDLSLAFALQSQEVLRDDLKILVMSATLDTDALKALLNNPPAITSEGRSFPVEIEYLPPQKSLMTSKQLMENLFSKITQILTDDEGNILVFLPGVREIKSLEQSLKEHCGDSILIAPLFGELSKADQERAIAPCAKRKIVLTTNIAETSLTIEGIRIVVDSGLERVMRFDAHSGMQRLVTQKISRASADQRTGRAGRLSAGKCYRLWSENAHHSLSAHRDPEITVCDLTPLALELSAWGDEELSWINPPPLKSLNHASALLYDLGATDNKRRIAPHGQEILKTGIHPRLAHMIIKGKNLGFSGEAIILATLLSERDIFARSDRRTADIRDRFWCICDRLANKPLPAYIGEASDTVIKTAKELARRIDLTLRLSNDFSISMIGILLAFAYPDRIARIRAPKGDKYLLSNAKEAILPREDDLHASEWLVVAESDGDRTMAQIYRCAPLEADDMDKYLHEHFHTEEMILWNSDTMRVEAREVRKLGAIVIESRPLGNPDQQRIQETLMEGIRKHSLESLPWSPKALSLRQRLQSLHHHFPEQSFGDYSDQTLLDSLESWLLPHIDRQSSLRECESLDLHTILSSQLSWEQIRTLETLFPSHFTAPTGNTISLDYSNSESVILSVRIQELFGLSTHPCIGEGKIPLLIHLLSPAKRPIQITRDLIAFWSGSYSDVKKELKGRYPKHYWPDDPLHAQATGKTKKAMQLDFL